MISDKYVWTLTSAAAELGYCRTHTRRTFQSLGIVPVLVSNRPVYILSSAQMEQLRRKPQENGVAADITSQTIPCMTTLLEKRDRGILLLALSIATEHEHRALQLCCQERLQRHSPGSHIK